MKSIVLVVVVLSSAGLCVVGQVQQCSARSKLVHQEKGDVTATVLLDITHGPVCDQTNPASAQSMEGILQTIRTLNFVQYLKGLKLGIRIYDTCGQESLAVQSVLESALESNLTHTLSCKTGAHLGFLFPLRSYPAAVQLLTLLNLPLTDISYWQTASPFDAVADLLIRLRWSSIAVVSQSKQSLLSFSKSSSDRNICIVAQSVLSTPVNRTKEMTVRAVRRSKRSGSKVYVLIGSSEFLLGVLPYFQASNETRTPSKYVLVAADNWNSNFSLEVGKIVQEALIIRPQRVLSDDNISSRVIYSLVKQFKNHLSSTCNGQVTPCDFEPQHIIKKMVLTEEDLRILNLSKGTSIYNELFPVSYVSNKAAGAAGSAASVVDIGNIHEDKFIPIHNMNVSQDDMAECTDCLCTNVDLAPTFVVQIRNELHIIIVGGVSLLGILLVVASLVITMHIQCCSNQEDKAGNFIFLILMVTCVLLLVSFLYVLMPSSILCLSRVIALSGAYTLFLAAVFSVLVTSLVGNHPSEKSKRVFVQLAVFLLAVGVQVPVLTYETLFRDETLLINKFLTDYGPKIECTLDDVLSFKLFLYPMVLLLFLAVGCVVVLYNHWQVAALKINLAISSLFVLVINIGWGVCYYQLDRQWRDVIIIAGIQGNSFTVLLGVALPKIVNGLQNASNSSVNKPWLPNGQNNNPDDNGNNFSSNVPPPPRQHIYAIPQHDYDRRSAASDYNQSTAM